MDCARGVDEEACEANALVIHRIEMRRLDPRVAVFADGAIALVIGENDDDVRFFLRERQQGDRDKAEEQSRNCLLELHSFCLLR